MWISIRVCTPNLPRAWLQQRKTRKKLHKKIEIASWGFLEFHPRKSNSSQWDQRSNRRSTKRIQYAPSLLPLPFSWRLASFLSTIAEQAAWIKFVRATPLMLTSAWIFIFFLPVRWITTSASGPNCGYRKAKIAIWLKVQLYEEERQIFKPWRCQLGREYSNLCHPGQSPSWPCKQKKNECNFSWRTPFSLKTSFLCEDETVNESKRSPLARTS